MAMGQGRSCQKISKHFARQPIRIICVDSNTNVCHKELMNPLIVNTDQKENDKQEADVPESKLSLGCCLKISAC